MKMKIEAKLKSSQNSESYSGSLRLKTTINLQTIPASDDTPNY